jgi:hypothetical protein
MCSKLMPPSFTRSGAASGLSATSVGSSSTFVIAAASPSALLMRCIIELT